ncbi:quinone oxidoreductase family protein [Sulfobacillus harzensis]|uniref:Zinc-binding alcohol dehydrogenase family protein n=1 Tax=Sulfobacillus harzensis TaxID=2729629 RepID=A0A7Y0L6U3_9FIRM|nr:zinc-binding alcohol dehydrogenase family protein [Sulfobacillus harzensis]NMP24088.1 zinc-binding alcohol dehydrogenase family protein [Sulfobacillus harzensis]
MRALYAKDPGEPLTIQEVEIPKPGPGEVLVRVEAAGINPSDMNNVDGRFPVTIFPCIPGRDFAGTVIEGPDEWKGQPVFGSVASLGFTRPGTHADTVVVPIAGLVKRPDSISPSQAGALGVPYTTAWQALIAAAHLEPGDTAIITGGRGAVATAALQIGHWAGARMIGVSHGDPDPMEGVEWVKLRPGWADEALAMTEGRGADVILDMVGGEVFRECQQALGYRGRMAAIASPSHPLVSLPILDFYHQQQTLLGVDSLKFVPEDSRNILSRIVYGIVSGALAGLPISEARLDDAVDVYQNLKHGTHGKWVLIP